MNTLNFLGNVSLNLSSFLYLILLIPQLIHNRKGKNISGLSIWLHFILFTSYLFDLIYGIADEMPLQYRVVSVVGLFLVMTQHFQLLSFQIKNKYYFLIKIGMFFIFSHVILTYYLFSKLLSVGLTHETILILGIISRVCEIIYCLPQIYKNWRAKSARAISLHFVFLNILLAILDTVAAWCLDWELPNKVIGPINIMIMFLIMFQYVKYAYTRPDKNSKRFRARHSKLSLA